MEPRARETIMKWIGDPDVIEYLETVTRKIYSNDPSESIAALSRAVVRIPIQNWAPR